MANVNYTEESVQSLSPLEHIRTRPGMYIGRLGDGSHIDDGIYILLKEIIADPVFSTPGASNSNAVKKLAEVTLLFRQRKTIY